MEGLARTEGYSLEWFQNRAQNSLTPLDENTWDFSDSLLLYTPDVDEGYDELQETDSPYHKLVTAPERAYLESVAPRVAAELPDRIEYVDLGPGTEHKEQFFFDALKERGVSFTYRPIDISERYLRLATEYATNQGIPTTAEQASFEQLAERLGAAEAPRFVSLGLTYSNYSPNQALVLLKEIAGTGGYAFINSQLRERVDMQELTRIYNEDASNFIEAKMRLLGLEAGKHYEQVVTDDGVRVWCTIREPNELLKTRGVKEGDVFLIFQSLRPTRESLEQNIASVFSDHRIYDTGSSFVAALLKS